MMKKLYAVIMAGGRGERFWPMGRKDAPKQLLKLTGESTMLEEAVLRLFPLVPPENILVITNQQYVDRVRALLPLPAENIVGEPVGRDTAPCVALAAALIRRRDPSPDATMAVLPADHVIAPAKALQDTLAAAADRARRGALVTIGITPTEAATGYGYIHCGDAVGDGFFQVKAFREKPDAATAAAFVRSGDFQWNSGIFIWTVATITAEFERHCPALKTFIARLTAAADVEAFLAREFSACPKISIDYAVMEKAQNVLVAAAPFAWNDIGSWSALRGQFPPDGRGNVVRGRCELLDCENCVVISDDSHLVGVIGMTGVAVVKSGNATLVCPLEKAQQVRELIRRIESKPDAAEYL